MLTDADVLTTLPRSIRAGVTCGLLLLPLVVAPAGAQIESGRVLDDSTLAPLARSRVILQRGAADSWTDVDTARTDAHGFFQFAPRPPGVYRVALLGKSEPMFLGAADTLAADSMSQREFRLPITRRGVASAYVESEVDRPARQSTGPSPEPDRSTMRLASVAGEANVRFVVETDGHVNPSTLRVVSATDPGRLESISQSLLAMRFEPATIGGIPVRQVVERKFHMVTRIERRVIR